MPTLSTIKLIVSFVVIFLAAGSASWVTHRADAAKLAKVELGYAQAQEKAVQTARAEQAAQDKVSLDAAVAEAQAQQKVVTVTQTITKEIIRHVQNNVACVSYGLVRVLDAGALGVDPDTLALPAGKSDSSCTTLTNDDLAAAITANYGIARANAEQLNALEAWVQTELHASASFTGGSAASHAPSSVAAGHVSGPAAPVSWPPAAGHAGVS